MTFLQIAGVGLVICAFAVMLRSYRSEYALFVAIAGGVVFLAAVVAGVDQVLSYAQGLLDSYNIPGQAFVILIKCLGISYIAKIAGDMCNDCGETAIGSKIELAAKVAILITAIPLFDGLLSTINMFAGG